MRHLLVFAHQCGRCYLCNHQARVQSWFFGKEGRQAVGEGRIYKQCYATLGNCTDFADREGSLVGCKGDRFGMEITA
ncbi:hypothetical protein D3C80_1818300 [compost metagenome]